MPWKACLSVQFTRAALCCGLIIGLLLFSPVRASARPVYGPERQQSTARDRNSSPTITFIEAEDLLNLLPVVKELRAKGMELKWDVQDVPTMNNKDYYFFWIYNVTAQKASDIGSISVGDYAVNKRTADVRVWQVSQDAFPTAMTESWSPQTSLNTFRKSFAETTESIRRESDSTDLPT